MMQNELNNTVNKLSRNHNKINNKIKTRYIDIAETSKHLHRMCKEKKLKVSDIQSAMQFSTPQSIYRWFSEKSTSLPSIDHLIILALLLGCTIDELLVIKECEL